MHGQTLLEAPAVPSDEPREQIERELTGAMASVVESVSYLSDALAEEREKNADLELRIMRLELAIAGKAVR